MATMIPKLFRRLHDRRAPPGAETMLLRRMPLIALVGTALPVAASLLVRFLPLGPREIDAAKQVATVDIVVIALIVTLWTAVLTVSIACIIVFVMKGPGYVADAYPLSDAARPAERDER